MRQQSLFLCGLCLLMAIVYSASAQSFYSSGGRYGKRTPENSMFQDTTLTRRSSRVWGRGSGEIQQIAPRAQFFLGSRYGKRATTPESDEVSGEEVARQLTCQYTGVVNLYRCFNSKENSPETEVTGSEAVATN